MTNNYLQPTSFKMIISRKNLDPVEYHVQSATHPSIIVEGNEVEFRTQTIPVPSTKVQYEDLQVNIILDEKFDSYIEIYTWLKNLITKNLSSPSPNLDEYSEIDVTLCVLDNSNNILKKIKYNNVFPTSIGSIEFISTAGGDQFIHFDVTFKIMEFNIE